MIFGAIVDLGGDPVAPDLDQDVLLDEESPGETGDTDDLLFENEHFEVDDIDSEGEEGIHEEAYEKEYIKTGHYGSPQYISLRNLIISISIFGGTGLISLKWFKLSPIESSIMGLIMGSLVLIILYGILRWLFSVSAYHTPMPQLYGRRAKVIVSIPKNGFGQVQTEIHRERHIFKAQSGNPKKSIQAGAEVEIIEVIPNSQIVKVKRLSA